MSAMEPFFGRGATGILVRLAATDLIYTLPYKSASLRFYVFPPRRSFIESGRAKHGKASGSTDHSSRNISYTSEHFCRTLYCLLYCLGNTRESSVHRRTRCFVKNFVVVWHISCLLKILKTCRPGSRDGR